VGCENEHLGKDLKINVLYGLFQDERFASFWEVQLSFVVAIQGNVPSIDRRSESRVCVCVLGSWHHVPPLNETKYLSLQAVLVIFGRFHRWSILSSWWWECHLIVLDL
jgi:hypothetical protein